MSSEKDKPWTQTEAWKEATRRRDRAAAQLQEAREVLLTENARLEVLEQEGLDKLPKVRCRWWSFRIKDEIDGWLIRETKSTAWVYVKGSVRRFSKQNRRQFSSWSREIGTSQSSFFAALDLDSLPTHQEDTDR